MIALIYIGSALSFVWGASHVAATRPVVASFGALAEDSRRILTMEWVAEGFALCFIGILGALVAAVGGTGDPVARVVFRTTAGVLFALSALASTTGAKTPELPFKLCPFVEGVAGVMFAIGSTG